MQSAIAVLNEFVAEGRADFHTYYRLAEYYRLTGEYSLSTLTTGWHMRRLGGRRVSLVGTCSRMINFSPMIPHWERRFANHVNAAPIQALEIGSWQGGSATWMLDKIISRRGGQLTCIDPFEGSSEHVGIMSSLGNTLENIFDENIARTGHGNLLRKLVGYGQDILPRLAGEKFDFIYIDGAHEAKFVIQDAVLCWGLLKQGGYMLFDDLNFFLFMDHPEQNTARATDFFLSVMAEDLEVLESQGQLFVRRVL